MAKQERLNQPTSEQEVRRWVAWLLEGGGAHAKFEDVIADFPAGLRGQKPHGLPYSAWQLLEHMRIAQTDILEFCTKPEYKEREWPAGYWPEAAAPNNEAAWEKSIRSFRTDLHRIQELVEDAKIDLHAAILWGDGQTILREALLVADHNAYHLGELVLLRRLLGVWK
jgi:uncharacterized damage-inducible protein DinB